MFQILSINVRNFLFFSVVCPNDFSYYYPPSNACFQMFNESMQWQDAKSFCEAKPGAQLASILNQAENQFTLGTFFSTKCKLNLLLQKMCIQTLIAGLPRASEHIWIGGNDIASEGSYKWTDGTSINYKPWVLHQPSDSDGSQDCIASQSNGWHDQICTIEYLVLCRRSYN